MKKFFKIALILLLLFGAIAAWLFFGSATDFSEEKKYLYIRSTSVTKQAVLDSLKQNNLVSNLSTFSFLADRFNYWESIKPGKYEIKKGSSLFTIVRTLRNGTQSPVNLVIIKFRTKEDFARAAGAKFEFGPEGLLAFFNSLDSMKKYGVDTANVFCNILPDTYRYYWSSSPADVYEKMYEASQNFWTEERKSKVSDLGLTKCEVYTLASIIEEETTNHKEKDTVASVYLNRLKSGMPLQADPTLKFAVRNFGLKRIAGPILDVSSPYNTYRNKGLPPGPICTPSTITINAVLNPAKTPFYYFVANTRLNGHLFSANFDEHVRKANQYREEDKARRLRDSVQRVVK